jgi:hypothetical protein
VSHFGRFRGRRQHGHGSAAIRDDNALALGDPAEECAESVLELSDTHACLPNDHVATFYANVATYQLAKRGRTFSPNRRMERRMAAESTMPREKEPMK